MPSRIFHAIVLAATITVSCAAQNDLRAAFEKLDDARDHDGIVALWRQNPTRTLGTIDSYLEGAMKLIEGGAKDPERIQAMHARALRGAIAADEAFGRVIFGDYASAFIGWDSEQRTRFRQGQAAFGAYRKLMRAARNPKLDAAKRLDTLTQALAEADGCLQHARPLGDWWGTAMGLGGVGAALEQLAARGDDAADATRLEQALDAHARARLVNHDLGLAGSELRSVTAMARILVTLGRKPRARVALDTAKALATSMGERGTRALVEIAALRRRLDG